MKIPTKFTIPDTIEGVAGLLTARKWEKAAIVYAWTKPDKPGPRPKGDSRRNTGIYGLQEFADLKIAGLTSEKTVSLYRNAWVWAIENGWTDPVGPGDEIDLADLGLVDFPPTDQGSYTTETEYEYEYEEAAQQVGVSKNSAKRAGSNKAALAAAIKADPAVRLAAREAIQEADAQRRPAADPHGKQNLPIDQLVALQMELRSAKRTLTEALGHTIDLRGITDTDELRASISGYVQQLRHVLNLIDEAAKGKSLDDELAELLQDEELR